MQYLAGANGHELWSPGRYYVVIGVPMLDDGCEPDVNHRALLFEIRLVSVQTIERKGRLTMDHEDPCDMLCKTLASDTSDDGLKLTFCLSMARVLNGCRKGGEKSGCWLQAERADALYHVYRQQ